MVVLFMFLTNTFDHLGIEPLNNIFIELGPFELFGFEIPIIIKKVPNGIDQI